MTDRRRWTPAELKVLRRLAGHKTLNFIARTLKRSPASVKFKAHSERIHLAMK